MIPIFTYLTQSSISLSVLYGLYLIFLNRQTFFNINRFYLTASVLFSALIPLFHFTLPQASQPEMLRIVLDTVVITAPAPNESSHQFSFYSILLTVYLTGATLFTLRFLLQLIQLSMLVKRYGIHKQEGLRLVFTEKHYLPFSAFGLIFINSRNIKQEELKHIIAHEHEHVKQHHSADLIMLEIITVIQWFNPAIWLLRTSLKSIHEYLADEGVIQQGVDKLVYQKILLATTMGIQVNDLTHNFNQSILKKRIIMMLKNPTQKSALWRLLPIAPVVMILALTFGCQNEQESQTNTTPTAVEQVATPDTTVIPQETTTPEEPTEPEEVFMVVENQPQFPGGDEARINYLVNNIKYPEKAQKAGVEGNVYITFIVASDGTISKTRLLRGVATSYVNKKGKTLAELTPDEKEAIKLIDAEALRIVQSMPTWEPGTQRGKKVAVQFNMPLSFRLQ